MPGSDSSSAARRLVHDLDLSAWVHVGAPPREPPRRLSSGHAGLDALLDGGLPRGRISEILGAPSCGKTSLLLSLLATATRRGEVAAWVDVTDALHPPTAAAAGADLRRLLWVRPPSAKDAVRCAELLLQAGGMGVVALDFGETPPRRLRGHVWPRLMRAAEHSRTPLLVLAPHGVAGSFATLGLYLRQHGPLWRRGRWPLFDGLRLSARLVRNRMGKENTVVTFLAASAWGNLR